MNTNTPETDSECGGSLTDDATWPSVYVASDFARRLERERDEARNQLYRICKEGFGNDDTIGLEPADDYALRKLAEMREAIKDAHSALGGCLKYILRLPLSGSDAECETMDDAHHALRKLKPFLK
jgi:hypothetical protein